MNASKVFPTVLVGAFMLAMYWPVEPPEPKAAKAAPTPAPRAEIAGGIDYSQEPGLPVAWEDITLPEPTTTPTTE